MCLNSFHRIIAKDRTINLNFRFLALLIKRAYERNSELNPMIIHAETTAKAW